MGRLIGRWRLDQGTERGLESFVPGTLISSTVGLTHACRAVTNDFFPSKSQNLEKFTRPALVPLLSSPTPLIAHGSLATTTGPLGVLGTAGRQLTRLAVRSSFSSSSSTHYPPCSLLPAPSVLYSLQIKTLSSTAFTPILLHLSLLCVITHILPLVPGSLLSESRKQSLPAHTIHPTLSLWPVLRHLS